MDIWDSNLYWIFEFLFQRTDPTTTWSTQQQIVLLMILELVPSKQLISFCLFLCERLSFDYFVCSPQVQKLHFKM